MTTARKYAMKQTQGGWTVYVLCENYAGHVRGGIAYTWRVACYRDKARRGQMVSGVTRDEATTYMQRVSK